MHVPEELLPDFPARMEEPPGLLTLTNLLSAALAQCCAQKQIAGSMVANVADLKQLIRLHLDGRNDEERGPCSFEDGVTCIFGGQHLPRRPRRPPGLARVVNSASEFPIALEP